MFSEWSREYVHLDPNQPPQNKLILRFRDGAVRNERLSADGPAVYDRLFQVQVAAVGQKQSAPEYTLVKIEDGKEKVVESTPYRRFKERFEEWRRNEAPSMEGMPLEEWSLMTRDLVRAFKDVNIFTVEMLAEAGDNASHHFKGQFFQWRGKAQAWLAQARKDGASVKTAAELADAQHQIAELKEQVAELLAMRNGSGEAFPRKKRGRPAKDDDAFIADLSAMDDAPEEQRI